MNCKKCGANNAEIKVVLNSEKYYLCKKCNAKLIKWLKLEQAKINLSQADVILSNKRNFMDSYSYTDQKKKFKRIDEYKDELDWKEVSKIEHLSDKVIEKYSDRLDWGLISKYHNLEYFSFVTRFIDRLDWDIISSRYDLCDSFLELYLDIINWELVSKYHRLIPEFINYWYDKLDWDIIRERFSDNPKINLRKQEKANNLYMQELEEKWNSRFELLKEFINEFNRFPKKTEVYKDINIGSWLYSQYNFYYNGKLSDEKIEKFRSININLYNNRSRKSWDYYFETLTRYVNKYGYDLNDMYRYVNIVEWYKIQKYLYKNGKLAKEKEEKLRSIGIELD